MAIALMKAGLIFVASHIVFLTLVVTLVSGN